MSIGHGTWTDGRSTTHVTGGAQRFTVKFKRLSACPAGRSDGQSHTHPRPRAENASDGLSGSRTPSAAGSPRPDTQLYVPGPMSGPPGIANSGRRGCRAPARSDHKTRHRQVRPTAASTRPAAHQPTDRNRGGIARAWLNKRRRDRDRGGAGEGRGRGVRQICGRTPSCVAIGWSTYLSASEYGCVHTRAGLRGACE